MTRINCLPVEVLSDKHLMAEYKEITRPFGKMRKRIESGKLDFVGPEKYTMGDGHETFFFNKLKYLHLRYCELGLCLVRRGFNIDTDKFNLIVKDNYDTFSGTSFWNDWKPTPEDMYVNMARLAHREFGDRLDEFK